VLEENRSYTVITGLYVSTIKLGWSCASFSEVQADVKYVRLVPYYKFYDG
jgi:hypothetical protein